MPSESFMSLSGFWNGDSEMEIEPWREWPRNHLHQAVALILTSLGRQTPWNYFTYNPSKIF